MCPVPRYNYRSGASRRRARRGEGGSAPWARRGKGNDPTRNRTPAHHLTPTKRREAANASARRRAAGAPGGRTETAGSPSRGRGTERGQRPSRPDRRRRGGQRARELPHLHPTPQHGRDHASGATTWRRGGRRRRRPGGMRTQEQAATHAISAGRTIEPQKQRDRRGQERKRPERRPGARPPGAANRRARNKLHCPAPRGAQGRADGQPGKLPDVGADGSGGARARFCRLAACLPSSLRFRRCGGMIGRSTRKNAQKGEKTRIRGLHCV